MTDKKTGQGDLFTFDSPLLTGLQGERSLMAYPFFALAKTAWTKPLVYKTDSVSIEVGPGPKGIATIYDKEILLYIASLMVSKLEAGLPVSQEFYFTANDLFRVTGVNASSRSYTRLSDALERLQGTQIKTDIQAGGEGEAGFFSWLESARLQYTTNNSNERRLKAVRVRLCDWLFRAILRDRHVLEYTSTYFQLGPVERRLYEVARSSCTDGPVSMTLEDLRLQLGYQSSPRHLKSILKDVIDANSIPGFVFSIAEPSPTDGLKSRKVAFEVVQITPEAGIHRKANQVIHKPGEPDPA